MVETKNSSENTVMEVIAGMREKKAFDINVLNLEHLNGSAASYFVICSGNSDRQTQAIADSVIDYLKKNLKDRPLRTEGYRGGQWILIDYFDVVVHIFLPKVREHFALEELWGDAHITKIENQ